MRRHSIRAYFSLSLYVALALLCAVPFLLHAQTAAELKDKISNTNSEIEKLEAEIAAFNAQLKTIGKEKDTLGRAIKELDLSSKKLNTDIKVTEKKIDSANSRIRLLGGQINDTGETIHDTQGVIAALMRKVAEEESTSLTEYLLREGTSLGDAWRYIDTVARAREAMEGHVDTLFTAKTNLEVDKQAVEKVREELSDFRADLQNQKRGVELTKKEKDSLLASTKNEESKYAALLKEKQQRKAQFAQELSDYESKLTYILDPSKIPASGAKVFNWPVKNPVITQLFGLTGASKRLYASGTHSGVDFGAPLGTPVMAVASGTVIGTGNTDLVCRGASYGNWILIAHPSGLTSVFGHLSQVTAKQGDKVYAGQVVAYSGSTGYSTGPHLHISVFPSDAVQVMQVPSRTCGGRTFTMPVAPRTAYLDPMAYFPPR